MDGPIITSHITITVIVNSDLNWSYREPRSRKEIEFSLPMSAACAMDYNQVIEELIAQADIGYKLECLKVEDNEDD